MADAPLAAPGVAEQARAREKEPAPAPHLQNGIAAIDLAEHGLDLLPVRVEIVQPIMRRALVMCRLRTDRHIAGSDDGSASRRR